MVDAFLALEIFRRETPESHRVLQTIGIEFEYDNDGHFLRFRHRLHTEDMEQLHSAVNWSPPFQARTIVGESSYYKACLDFEKILTRPELRIEFLMQEGDMILFDNRRILHARKAFQDPRQQAGSRWLKGCYLEGEVVWDKMATLLRC